MVKYYGSTIRACTESIYAVEVILKYTKSEWKQILKNFALVVAGTLVLSFGTAVFILPFELVSGGVSGYSIVLSHIIPIEFLTADRIVTILTWLLFFLGFVVMGKSFALKTLISTVVYPIGTSIFVKLADPSVMGGFLNLGTSQYSDISVLLAALFGGLCVGVGCAITFLGGGSTGGVDVLAFLLCKIFKRLKSSVAFFAVDATAVVLGMFVIGDFVVSLLGIISAFLAAVMVDKVFLGGNDAFIAQIVTKRHEAVNRAVIERMDRTSTIMDVTGGYSGDGMKMVMVSFTIRQYTELMNIISHEDKSAFVTIHRAHEINGEGWTR